jgi:flagellar hook protein FlgE
LGNLGDIRLLTEPKATLTPAEENPFPYGTGWSLQKEADGLYSLHGSATYADGCATNTKTRYTFVDSLGQEHMRSDLETLEMFLSGDFMIGILAFSGAPHAVWDYSLSNDETLEMSNCTVNEATKQVTMTFSDTGAQLTIDWSDFKVSKTEGIHINSGDTLSWPFPPLLMFGEGVEDTSQTLSFDLNGVSWSAILEVTHLRDRSLRGWIGSTEIYFNEEGWVSGYKLPNSDVKHTGALIKGAGYGGGTYNIDLSSFRIVNKTGADLTNNGSTIQPDTSSGEAGTPSVPSKTSSSESPLGGATSSGASVSLSPSSVSIDENGVLKRLKDDGDWEPVYLLACGQFAAMNFAEERNGVYYATPASGALTTGVSGKDGMGTITSGTLERSTTDLAHELSEMIKAQHAYAANTKVLSTLDDMLEELERL